MANNSNDFDMKGINFENVSTTKFGYREEDRSTVAATKGYIDGQKLLIGVVGLALVFALWSRDSGLKINNYNSGDGTKIEHRQR